MVEHRLAPLPEFCWAIPTGRSSSPLIRWRGRPVSRG